MSASNYDDVLDQLRAGGLIVDTLQVGTPRMVRCKVEGGDREKRGWYMLHELPDLERRSAHRRQLRRVARQRPGRAEDRAAQGATIHPRAARRAAPPPGRRSQARRRRSQAPPSEQLLARPPPGRSWAADGDSDYLARKGVGAHGLRFTANGSAVLPLLDTAGRIHGLQFLRTAPRRSEGEAPRQRSSGLPA
jgi:putative DNA primase/helicase